MSKDKQFALMTIGFMVLFGAALAYQVWPRTPGTVQVLTPDAELILKGNWLSEIVVRDGEPQVVPSGRLGLLEAVVTSGRGPEAYRLRCLGPWGHLKDQRVEASQTTSLRFGPPFTYKVKMQRRGGRIVDLVPVIVGSQGEQYQIDVTKGGRRVPAPRFHIVSKDGTVLHKGKFGFG